MSNVIDIGEAPKIDPELKTQNDAKASKEIAAQVTQGVEKKIAEVTALFSALDIGNPLALEGQLRIMQGEMEVTINQVINMNDCNRAIDLGLVLSKNT